MTTTATLTLTDFILSRIAEDEAEFGPEPWLDPVGSVEEHHAAAANRVLAECEAKRRIVEALEDERQRKDIYNRDYPLGLLTTEGDHLSRLSSNARWAGLEIAARALAAIYADHPDYDEAWRP